MKRTFQNKDWIEKEYFRYQGLIKSFANRFHQRTGIPFDDLEEEAVIAFVKACHVYDPTKGKKQNLFYTYLLTELQGYCLPERVAKFKILESKDQADPQAINQEEKLIRKQSIEQSSDELKFLIELLLTDPLPDPMKMTIKNITKRLRGLGWKWKEIYAVIKEGKEIVKSWT